MSVRKKPALNSGWHFDVTVESRFLQAQTLMGHIAPLTAWRLWAHRLILKQPGARCLTRNPAWYTPTAHKAPVEITLGLNRRCFTLCTLWLGKDFASYTLNQSLAYSQASERAMSHETRKERNS